METLQIENEQLALEQEYEKYHWRDRISRKSGAECHYHNGSGHEGEEGLCEEDSRDGVSINENIYPIGKCCYCGNENYVYICEICGAVFNDFGGENNLCNKCLLKIDE